MSCSSSTVPYFYNTLSHWLYITISASVASPTVSREQVFLGPTPPTYRKRPLGRMAAAPTPFEAWRSSQVEEADDKPLLDAFAALLAPGSTISAAASAIAEATSAAILALPDSDAEVPLWRLFRWTSKLAQGVPDAHERLIRLLIALRGTPPLERTPGGGQVLVWGVRKVWGDLPMLGPAMVEAYNSLSPCEIAFAPHRSRRR